eukprot:Stramenopile-MAST_4_protein_1782
MATMATVPSKTRTKPNILVTGTPGTGKTSTASLIAELTGLNHINCSALVKSKQLSTEKNDEYDCLMLDEDALCDEIEDTMDVGGNIVDFHSIDFFPERWFDLVLVLRTDNTILYDRLQKRAYNQKKLQENVECEIMQVVLEEARNSYNEDIIHEVQSDNIDQMESNVERVQEWLKAWVPASSN